MRRPGEGRRGGRAGRQSFNFAGNAISNEPERDLVPRRGDLRAEAVARSLRVLNENRAEREQTRVALLCGRCASNERPPER